ncbi:MAG: ABC transporter [Elusimicrobia bacterium CG08_land_8_20_14_0_20_51_18]|nr:MAG: ABC transporter [Elusimicrobia bacterium CG08_land_8_20_14_0_20_51_18]
MINFQAIYAILLREIKVFVREKERIISILISPLLFLFVIGRGISSSLPAHGYTYQQFIFPGILAMVILFTSITYGLYIIWDKRLDFLKEVLVAPISRATLFLGKASGGIFGALIETLMLLAIGAVFILPITPLEALLCFLTAVPVSFMIVSIGLSIGGLMKSMEGFGLVMSFLTWPMFFFSGALFEIKDTDLYLKVISLVNPFTYCVDLMRKILLDYSSFSLAADLGVISAWIVITSFVGIKIFGNLQQNK